MARPKGSVKNGLKYLDEAELKRFSEAVKAGKSLRDYLMFALILRFGLRCQEAVNIKLTHINEDSKQITVYGLKSGRTRTYDLGNGDGYRPDRENELWLKLKRWLSRERKKIDPKGMNPYLFPSKLYQDKPITPDSVKASFKRYAGEAGLSEDFSVHSLRHSCAINLVKKNWSGVRVMNWLRHRSINSTTIYFEQLQSEQDDAEANEAFGKFL